MTRTVEDAYQLAQESYERGHRRTAPPPEAAVALSAFRGVNGVGRQYTTTEFVHGWQGVEWFTRLLDKIGYIRPCTADTSGYAVLDVLDADGEIIADYDIPTARAFRYVYRKLDLRVEQIPEGCRNR